MKKYSLALLFLPLICQAEVTSFDKLFSSMTPVDKHQTIDSTYQTPLYRKLQLEVRTAGNDPLDPTDGTRVGLKLSPLAWGQFSKEAELYKEYKTFSKTLNREGSSRECLFRSMLFTNAYHTKVSLVILKKLNQYLEDENKLLKRGIGENQFEFKEILSVREALMKNKLKISALEKLSLQIEKELAERVKTAPTLKDISFKNFVDINKIKTVDLTTEPKRIELSKLSTMVKIQNLEFEIEKSEAHQILESITLFHWDDENFTNRIRYGIEFTFNLPFFNKRTYLKDAVQRQLAINKLSASQRDVISELDGTELSFRNKIDHYEALKDSDYYKTLKSLKTLLSGSRNNSPLMILQTKVKMANERLKVLDLKQEIIHDYLSKLYSSGQISTCESPDFLVKN
ncbi:MAG TPA: hypothetical protein VNJ08_07105 [Bacteriovoracaceae bacterium]|nr:hypothetical protein [Bacteriovoracaceae bacterium]